MGFTEIVKSIIKLWGEYTILFIIRLLFLIYPHYRCQRKSNNIN
jgi:hypothetical protein